MTKQAGHRRWGLRPAETRGTALGVRGPSLLAEALIGRHIHVGLKRQKKELFIDKHLCLEKEIFQKMESTEEKSPAVPGRPTGW